MKRNKNCDCWNKKMVRESNGILGFKNPVFENPTRRVVLGFLGFIIFGL